MDLQRFYSITSWINVIFWYVCRGDVLSPFPPGAQVTVCVLHMDQVRILHALRFPPTSQNMLVGGVTSGTECANDMTENLFFI